MKKMKRIVKAVRNWLVGICGASLFMGFIFAVLISLPIIIIDLLQKKKIDFFRLIGLPILFMEVSCSIIVAGIFFRLLEQSVDKDPEITEKFRKINQSDLSKAFSNFIDFFC